MSKIVVHRGSVEQIVELSDVQVISADYKNMMVRLVGADWLVKNPKNPTLKALHAISAGGHIYASRFALIAVNAIVGRISNYEIAGHFGAVMRDGSIVKIARRESAAFNRVYRGLL